MYRYLLFDLDGTLTDPEEGITKSVQHALRYFGIEVADLKKLRPFIGPPLIPAFMDFYGLSEKQAVKALEVYREHFGTVGIFENRVLEGIPELLQTLHARGKCLVVASSKPEVYVRRILEHFDLLRYFDEVVGATMDEKLSAKPDIIALALRKIREKHGWDGIKGEVVMIGDRKHDVEGAKACGLDSLGLYTGFAEDGELERAGATHICRSVKEMAQLLTRQAPQGPEE